MLNDIDMSYAFLVRDFTPTPIFDSLEIDPRYSEWSMLNGDKKNELGVDFEVFNSQNRTILTIKNYKGDHRFQF